MGNTREAPAAMPKSFSRAPRAPAIQARGIRHVWKGDALGNAIQIRITRASDKTHQKRTPSNKVQRHRRNINGISRNNRVKYRSISRIFRTRALFIIYMGEMMEGNAATNRWPDILRRISPERPTRNERQIPRDK